MKNVLVAALLSLTAISATAHDNGSNITRRIAITECKRGILRDAHDPGSVKFTDTTPVLIRSVSDSGLVTIDLTMEIRAKNGHNGLRKEAVTCKFFEFDERDIMLYQVVQSE